MTNRNSESDRRTSAMQKKMPPAVKDFTYRDFKKIACKIELSQAEWSDLLHISERTLQRYSKSDGIFSFGVTDRLLEIEKVINKGITVFDSADDFLSWLRSEPETIYGPLNLHSLSSIDGIQKVFNELGRIEQGIFS